MKTRIISLLFLAGFAAAALAIEPAELDNRIQTLTEKFDALQHQGDKGIAADNLRRAKGIMLLDRTKAGFLFAYQGGSGVAMVKDAAGKWSAPSFVKANEASLGFQVGGEQHFVVVLFMTTNAVNMLGDQKFDFSGEARGTAGNESSGVQTKSPTAPAVLVYDDRQGLYAGAAVKGGATTTDQDANRAYYGDYFTARDILFHHQGHPTPAATELAQKIDAWAHPSQTGADRAER